MITAVVTYFQWIQGFVQSLVTVLVLIWGIRLSSHIGFRKILERKEDPRYAKWREEWWDGSYFYIRSFLQVYILQMLLLLVVATAIIIVNLYGTSEYNSVITYIGVTIAVFGLIFESIADRELAEFIKIKKPGEIFISGLYRYSRHPNYFGESMFWLGISVIATQYSYFGLISWIVITILLLFVSGVPLQEARYAGRPNWEEYKARTSVFVPWFHRK
jgi:steroid 5-alpha reductase family enzyme